MAHVTLPDGRELDVDDSNGVLLAYYEHEGATITGVQAAAAFPQQYDDGTPVVPPGEYDPAEHTVEEVLAHLDGADEAEVERVLDLERAGKNRTTLLGEYETSEQ